MISVIFSFFEDPKTPKTFPLSKSSFPLLMAPQPVKKTFLPFLFALFI